MGILKSNQITRPRNLPDMADQRRAVTLTWDHKGLNAVHSWDSPTLTYHLISGMSIKDHQQVKNSQMSLGLQLGSVPCS